MISILRRGDERSLGLFMDAPLDALDILAARSVYPIPIPRGVVSTIDEAEYQVAYQRRKGLEREGK